MTFDKQQHTNRQPRKRAAAIRCTRGALRRVEAEQPLTQMGHPVNNGKVASRRREVAQIAPTQPPASKQLELSFEVQPKLASASTPGGEGTQAFRDAIPTSGWACERFGETWQVDICSLSLDPSQPGRGNETPATVQLIVVIDDATRLLVGWGVVHATADRSVRGADVRDVLIAAVNRYGPPEEIVMDSGPAFANDTVRDLLSDLGTRVTTRYRGDRKDKLERFFRAIATGR